MVFSSSALDKLLHGEPDKKIKTITKVTLTMMTYNNIWLSFSFIMVPKTDHEMSRSLQMDNFHAESIQNMAAVKYSVIVQRNDKINTQLWIQPLWQVRNTYDCSGIKSSSTRRTFSESCRGSCITKSWKIKQVVEVLGNYYIISSKSTAITYHRYNHQSLPSNL